jgi:hypothetical protein
MASCRSCRADWSAGAWSAGCKECGGGALTVPCGMCLGACGQSATRAVMDSNDFGLAHWNGGCGSP